MQLDDDRSAPAAWIPWILALAAVFGWSALAPDHLTVGKGKRQDGIGLVQTSDDLPAPGVAPHPFAGLPPGSGGTLRSPGLSPGLLPVEAAGRTPVIEARGGRIQGRAPPARA